MPVLKPVDLSAEIVWLGHVPDRDARLESRECDRLQLCFAGPVGEAHGGLTRPACSRVADLYPRGTEIRNTRQISIVSEEELDTIARELGLPALDPSLVGAGMVLRGLPDFSHLPPSSRLLAPSGAALVVDMENRPCTLPARPIETAHPGHGARFKRAASGRRGVTAWVEAEGSVARGDTLRLFIPDQPQWAFSPSK